MLKNPPLLLFLTIIGLSACWFSLKTVYEIYRYYTLDAQSLPSELSWSVKERGLDRYTLTAHYRFVNNATVFPGVTDLPAPVFKNKEAAAKSLNENKKKQWPIWHSSAHPVISSIEKIFPTKGLVYTAILWGLFCYFLFLGFYVKALTWNR